ncbi:MAG TPA: hypothetical protein GX726_05530 [Clostridiales bacterium]|nr:hypothetical protein [Clostridiales bacterium]
MDDIGIEDQADHPCRHAGQERLPDAQQIAAGSDSQHTESGDGSSLGHSKHHNLIQNDIEGGKDSGNDQCFGS